MDLGLGSGDGRHKGPKYLRVCERVRCLLIVALPLVIPISSVMNTPIAASDNASAWQPCPVVQPKPHRFASPR